MKFHFLLGVLAINLAYLEDFSCLKAAQILLKLTNTYYVIYQIRFIVLKFRSTTLNNFVLVESLKIIINNKERVSINFQYLQQENTSKSPNKEFVFILMKLFN